MKIFLALLLISFIALSGYHFTFRGVRMPFISRKLYFTGTEFLFLGILLGPVFLNILDKQTIEGLAPIKSLILGWIGLLFGFQFEIQKLQRFPVHYFQATLIECILTLGIVFAFVCLIFPLFFQISFYHL